MSDSVIVWDIETILDLKGFAAANDLVGKTDDEIRAAHGDKFPKHVFHRIICIGAVIAERAEGSWHVKASGAPHIGERSEKELIDTFVGKIAELQPQLVTFNGSSFDLPVLRSRDGSSGGALRECELAISLDSNYAWAHALVGLIKMSLGRAEETEAHVADAFRLSPREPLPAYWEFLRGAADLLLGGLDRAVDRLRKSVETNPNFGPGHYYLTAALALAGHEKEAADASAAGRRLFPAFSVANFRSRAKSGNATFLAQRERVIEGLRKARVPEE
jgi:tetratricopeptide (TPR) repeat protein